RRGRWAYWSRRCPPEGPARRPRARPLESAPRAGPAPRRREAPMQFHPGPVDGVILKPLKKYHDGRGWLRELFRHDDGPAECQPVMAYLSRTAPGVARGPHEHVDQADYFCFLGPSNFKVYLWDCRPHSPTHLARQVETLGADRPALLIVPPGVVHAYKNV